MAGMKYLDILTTAELISSVRDQRALVKILALNAVSRVASAIEWPYLWTNDFFASVAEYTTGTVSVTNGSATVTGSGTTFTSAMVGRKFRIDSQSAYYTILSVASATSLTLEQNFQGDTASAQNYTIYQDEYLLRADVDLYKVIRQIEDGRPLISRNISDFDKAIGAPEGMGSAVMEMQIGRHVGVYETGTVTISSGSRTLTGSSTSWTSARGLSKGTKIRIGTALYTVNTVDSDTQITLYEAASAAASASVYTAVIDNVKVQLYTIPDVAENYYYRFQRIPAVLDRDADYPDLPAPIHPLIVEEMLIWLWQYKGQPEKALSARTLFESNLAKAIARYGHPNSDRTYQRASADRHHDRRLETQWLLGV